LTDDRIDLLHRLYSAFAQKEGASMAACYHPEAHFTDPVFDLHGSKIGAIWTMLTERAKEFRIEFRDLTIRGDTGHAHWEAWYLFSATGRSVHNVIDAEFQFRDGLILRHIDRFGFWRWSRQALGWPGVLLGWSGSLRRKVRATAAENLESYVAGQKL